jgi:hypothetical protein
MNFEKFAPETARTTKKSATPVLVPANFEQRMRRSIVLQREYNAELRELIDLQAQLMALDSMRRRAAPNANPGLFRVSDVN